MKVKADFLSFGGIPESVTDTEEGMWPETLIIYGTRNSGQGVISLEVDYQCQK